MVLESLLKVLAEAGIGSRRWLFDAIRQGRVKVNGEVVEALRFPVDRERDGVSVDGKRVDLSPRRLVYLMLNKPQGVVSTTEDERGRKTVLDILPKKYRRLRLYPVGRLDRESTGLLLLTNDGELTYRLTHPRFEHGREYLVYIDSRLRPGEKSRLEQGIKLEEGMTHRAQVREVKSPPPFNYNLTIHEGRKRQVRRMFAALGYNILALKRVRMGNLNLGELQEGEVRELSAREVHMILSGKPS